jgi:hypothetical protein
MMHPSERDLDRLASRLAGEVANDEQQLLELGAAVFTTAKLLELKGRLRERLDQFDFWHGQLMRAAAWSPAFLAAGAALLWLKFPRLGWLMLVAFPVILAGALAGVILLMRNYGGRSRIENRLEEVEAELKSRRM